MMLLLMSVIWLQYIPVNHYILPLWADLRQQSVAVSVELHVYKKNDAVLSVVLISFLYNNCM